MQVDYVLYRTVDGFRISGAIRQANDLFRMPVEIVAVSGDREESKTVEINGKSTPFDFIFFSRPEKIMADPQNKILRDSVELRTSVQIALGDDMRRSNNFVEAVRAYDQALRLSPRRSLARYKLGETFFEQYSLQSAANSFREALNGEIDPKWVEVWCHIYLGKIYDILGQRQRALAEYTMAQNTRDDTNGAQAEAAKWLETPYVHNRGGEYGGAGPDAAEE
jgi:tetratricopeptide (TPR) repeat protein